MLLLCQPFPLHSSLSIPILVNLPSQSPLLDVMTVFASFMPITNPAVVVDCGTPPAAHVNGNPPVYTTTTFGSTVYYTCQSGYMRIGDRYITCLANGQWNASAPDCGRELNMQQQTFVSWWYCTSTVKQHPDSVMPGAQLRIIIISSSQIVFLMQGTIALNLQLSHS